jgi:DNA-binding NarL/FixJ family response regulator
MTGDGSNGIEYGKKIRDEFPGIKVIAMTALPEITFIEAAQKAGIHSFIYKNASADFLHFVINSTMEGRGIYPGPADEHPLKNAFNETEIAILRMVCQGKDRDEIAESLKMSERNVRRHITGILDKTGFDSIMKFVVYAVGKGLIAIDV